MELTYMSGRKRLQATMNFKLLLLLQGRISCRSLLPLLELPLRGLSRPLDELHRAQQTPNLWGTAERLRALRDPDCLRDAILPGAVQGQDGDGHLLLGRRLLRVAWAIR